MRSSPVVELLDAPDPIAALRRFLDNAGDPIAVTDGQIALGAAQLMLLPIAREDRGGAEVKALLDLMLARWSALPDRAGFHAQEFLRNAFSAVGDDPVRIARLSAIVPASASAELWLAIACAHAVSGDFTALLDAIAAALAAGATPEDVRRADDFAPYANDRMLAAALRRAPAPTEHDVHPHVQPVFDALEHVVGVLVDHGVRVELGRPATLETIAAAERAANISLPNDYRALLTIHDGAQLWDRTLFGTADYRGETELARRAHAFLDRSAIDDCVPLATWGQTNDWLLYDPRGRVRGEPGYFLLVDRTASPSGDAADAEQAPVSEADGVAIEGLPAALAALAAFAADVLSTN